MTKYVYEVRKKSNGEVVAKFYSEVKAMGWFQRQYPYSFETALAVGDYDLICKDTTTGKEVKISL